MSYRRVLDNLTQGEQPIGGGSYDQYAEGAFQQQPSFNYDSGQLTTMEVPTYSSSNIFGQGGALQAEMDDYFSTKPNFNFNEAESLGVSNQIVFGGS